MKLFEYRRNPETNTGNRWRNVVEQIEPYFGLEDAFISMVDIPKVGIPPRTIHTGTPTGIYTYPLASPEICEQFKTGKLPYKAYAPYVALVRATRNDRWFCNDASQAQVEHAEVHLDHIMHQFLKEKDWEAAKAVSLNHSWRYDFPASHFYSFVWMAASVINRKAGLAKEGNSAAWGYLEPKDYLHYMHNEDAKRPAVWNSLWRKLGFDVIHDMGSEMIYNIEPWQTCFLTKAAISDYTIHRNGREDALRTHKTEIHSAAHLFRLIESGKLPVDHAMEFIDAILGKRPNPGHMEDMKFFSYNENIRLTPAQVRQCIDFLRIKNDPWVTNLLMRYKRIADYIQ